MEEESKVERQELRKGRSKKERNAICLAKHMYSNFRELSAYSTKQ